MKDMKYLSDFAGQDIYVAGVKMTVFGNGRDPAGLLIVEIEKDKQIPVYTFSKVVKKQIIQGEVKPQRKYHVLRVLTKDGQRHYLQLIEAE